MTFVTGTNIKRTISKLSFSNFLQSHTGNRPGGKQNRNWLSRNWREVGDYKHHKRPVTKKRNEVDREQSTTKQQRDPTKKLSSRPLCSHVIKKYGPNLPPFQHNVSGSHLWTFTAPTSKTRQLYDTFMNNSLVGAGNCCWYVSIFPFWGWTSLQVSSSRR